MTSTDHHAQVNGKTALALIEFPSVNGHTKLFFIFPQLPYFFHHLLDRETERTRELDVSTAWSLLLTLGPVKEVLIMRYSAHLASRDLL